MSYLSHPYRYHSRVLGGYPYHHWSLQGPASFSVTPWPIHADPFGFSQPFISLFNDTFSQLDRLGNELNTQFNVAFNDNEGNWSKLLTFAPRFNVKETDKAYILEGELPGVEKENISLDFVDDNTLVLKTKTETFREEGPKPGSEPQQPKPNQAQVEDAPDADVEMSGANPDASTTTAAPAPAATASAAEAGPATETATPSTEVTKQQTSTSNEVAKPAATTTYHLTERTVGTFQRAFSFSAPVNHAAVTASLKNGVLTVTVPKVEPTKPEEQQKVRSVNVTVEDAPEAEAEAATGSESEKAKL